MQKINETTSSLATDPDCLSPYSYTLYDNTNTQLNKMYGQNNNEFHATPRQPNPKPTPMVEASPVEKMVLKAISSITDCKDTTGCEINNDESFVQGSEERKKKLELEHSQLCKQLDTPWNKTPVATTNAATPTPPASSYNVYQDTFGHQVHPAIGLNSQTWKMKLPNGNSNSVIANGAVFQNQNQQGETGRVVAVAKKRQYNKKPKIEIAAKPIKGPKIVKTTQDVIREVNFMQASQLNGMENFELAHKYDSETNNTTRTATRRPVAVSNFVSSPEKSSNHSLCPEYSEEIPPQSLSYFQQQPQGTSSGLSQPSQSTSYVQQQSQVPSTSSQTQSQNTLNENSGFQQTETQQISQLLELNRQLIKEITKLRMFIKAQKIRIDTLIKHNDDLRNDLNQVNFQKEYENVEKALGPLAIQAQNGNNREFLQMYQSLLEPYPFAPASSSSFLPS